MGERFRTGTDNRRDLDNNWRTCESRLSMLEGMALAAAVRFSGNTDVASTSATALTGSALTVTPMEPSTLLVIGSFDTQCLTFGGFGPALVIELVVNGVTQSAGANHIPVAVNLRLMLSQVWTVAALANTAYALSCTGRLTSASPANSHRVFASHSGYTVLTIPTV